MLMLTVTTYSRWTLLLGFIVTSCFRGLAIPSPVWRMVLTVTYTSFSPSPPLPQLEIPPNYRTSSIFVLLSYTAGSRAVLSNFPCYSSWSDDVSLCGPKKVFFSLCSFLLFTICDQCVCMYVCVCVPVCMCLCVNYENKSFQFYFDWTICALQVQENS